MASMSQADEATVRREKVAPGVYAPGGLLFDGMMSVLALWFMTGLYLDGWAHSNILDLIDDFFTPWHITLYSGVGALGAALAITLLRNIMRGYDFRYALPDGYFTSLIGVVVFFAAGFGDFIWHAIFGIEGNVEALLSPTHIILTGGAILFATGPFRAVWKRTDDYSGWAKLWPAILSMFVLLSVLTFISQYASGFARPSLLTGSTAPTQSQYFSDVVGISYVLIPSMITMFVFLLAMRRWTLPPGTFTLLITLNALIMALMHFRQTTGDRDILIGVMIGAVLNDVLYALLKPSMSRANALRVFAFSAPFALYLCFFIALIVTDGVWWKIHMWMGVPVVAGAASLGLSYLLLAPDMPGD